jgi:hypothetical protein
LPPLLSPIFLRSIPTTNRYLLARYDNQEDVTNFDIQNNMTKAVSRLPVDLLKKASRLRSQPVTLKRVLVPPEQIEKAILFVRGERVILDSTLANLFGVSTTRLNQQVRRNLNRFPRDFMFQLTAEEYRDLMLQFATSKPRRGGRRKLPFVFTEHGIVMAANILNSERAVDTSVQIVRAFVRLRELVGSSVELARKLDALEQKYDRQFKVVFDAIRHLMLPPSAPRKLIGFRPKALKK